MGGIGNWRYLAVFWALIPIANILLFAKVPIDHLIGEDDQGLSMKKLLSMKIFWVMLLMMVCAGASEQAVSQWASAFTELGLGVSKTVGNLAGPMMFALFALAGDVGCSVGPAIVGTVSGRFGDNLDYGILSAIIFPVLLLAGIGMVKALRRAS